MGGGGLGLQPASGLLLRPHPSDLSVHPLPPVGLQLPPHTRPAARSTVLCGLPCAPSKGNPKGLACPRLPDPWRAWSVGHLPGSPFPASPEAALLPHAPGGTRLPKWRSLQHHGSHPRSEETGQRWSVTAKVTQTSGNGENLGLNPDLGVFTQPLDTTKGDPNADCHPMASALVQWRQLGGPCVPRIGGWVYPQPGPQPRGMVSSVWRLWGTARVPGMGGQGRGGRWGHSHQGPGGTGVPAIPQNSASCHLPKRSTCPGI